MFYSYKIDAFRHKQLQKLLENNGYTITATKPIPNCECCPDSEVVGYECELQPPNLDTEHYDYVLSGFLMTEEDQNRWIELKRAQGYDGPVSVVRHPLNVPRK